MSTFVSHSRPCHSPTWQECCPGTPIFSHVVILYDFVLHLLVALHLSFIRDIFFFTVSTTPSRWCCVWASQQQFVSLSPSSAFKQRSEKKKSFFGLIFTLYLITVMYDVIYSSSSTWHHTKVCCSSSAWSCSSLGLCWHSSSPFNM